MTQLETLIEEIPKYQPGADLDVLARAYRFSAASHQGQQRASGEPYLSPSPRSRQPPRRLQDGRHHGDGRPAARRPRGHRRHQGRSRARVRRRDRRAGRRRHQDRQAGLLLARGAAGRELPEDAGGDGARPARAHDQARRPPAQHAHPRLPAARADPKIAQETLDIYAPLAHRLGMAKVKAELEDLALRTLEPEATTSTSRSAWPSAASSARPTSSRSSRSSSASSPRSGIESQIRGRPKHFYSIWKKMHDQGREFDEIYDLTAVRVITARCATATAPSA